MIYLKFENIMVKSLVDNTHPKIRSRQGTTCTIIFKTKNTLRNYMQCITKEKVKGEKAEAFFF